MHETAVCISSVPNGCLRRTSRKFTTSYGIASYGIDCDDAYKTLPTLNDPKLHTHTHAPLTWMFTPRGVLDVALKFSGFCLTDGFDGVIGAIRVDAAPVPIPAATNPCSVTSALRL